MAEMSSWVFKCRQIPDTKLWIFEHFINYSDYILLPQISFFV